MIDTRSIRLTDVSIADLYERLGDSIAPRLAATVRNRAPGHCMRVDDLPEHVARRLANFLRNETDAEAYVLLEEERDGVAISATKLVERRNSGAKVLVFIPPGTRTAAEDSFGASTFEGIALAGSIRQLREELTSAAFSGTDEPTRLVIDQVVRHVTAMGGADDVAFARYFATLVDSGATTTTAGLALYQLGLLPDADLLAQGEDLLPRLARNRDLTHELSRPDRTVFEKLQAARLNSRDPRAGDFRRVVYDFFAGLRSLDPFDWSRRIALNSALAELTFDRWPLVEVAAETRPEIVIHPFSKLRPNDEGYPRLVLAQSGELAVSWETTPPPIHCPNLAGFTVELYQGDSPVTEARNVKRGAASSARRSTKLRDLHKRNLEEGLHLVRVTAYSEDGDILAYEDSEPIFVELERGPIDEVEESSSRVEPVTSIYHIELLRRLADRKGEGLAEHATPTASWSQASQSGATNRVDTYVVRFSSKEAYGIAVNDFLHSIEDQILDEPETLGLYQIDLSGTTITSDSIKMQEFDHLDYEGLDTFLATRWALFSAIRGDLQDEVRPIVGTTDLRSLREQILAYAEAYRAALAALAEGDDAVARTRAGAQLLAIDTLAVRTRGGQRVALMAPTHPLKVLWLYQYARVLETWGDQLSALDLEDAALGPLRRAVTSLTSLNLPAFLVEADGAALTNLDQFDFFWSMFLPPAVPDPRALISEVRTALGARRGDASLTTVGSDQLAGRLRRYLSQHPYVTTLVINVVQPGSGAVLVDTLLKLQALLHRDSLAAGRDIRFRVRLLAQDLIFDELGSALDELMHQDVVVLGRDAEGIDAFLTASANPLFPKLAFSKHDVQDLLDQPAEFDAHLTFLLDFFAPQVVATGEEPDSRSAYVHGLLYEPAVRYWEQAGHAVWQRTISAAPATDLPNGTGVATEIADILDLHQAAAARLLGDGGVPASRLDLDPVRASILNQVHQVSDWVVVVDRNFGIELLDVPQPISGPTYLIDYAPEGALEGGHRIITSSARVEELRSLVRPALGDLDVPAGDSEVDLVLEALKSLSGRLVLQLQAAHARPEMLGLAFTRLFLRQSGLLSEMFIVPLDAHLSLFAGAASEGAGTSLSRSDLILVEPMPERRALVLHLIEAKLRSSVTGEFMISQLRSQIDNQLANTESVLLAQFSGSAGEGRVDQLLRTKQLTSLLAFYLDRARRYGLITAAAATDAKGLLQSLDKGYSISVTRNAVIVDRSGTDYTRHGLDGTTYHLLGRAVLASLLTEPAERTTEPIVAPTTAMLEATRASFRRGTDQRPVTIIPASERIDTGAVAADQPHERVESDAPSTSTMEETSPGDPSKADREGTPRYDVLLGATHETAQYGILGRASDRVVALDLNGTQTISLFGVQGSGKSYSLGTILEIATRPIPSINTLRQPLASVLFHYSSDQTYRPEFVSMIEPNPTPGEIATLEREYQAMPAALGDVLVLTPEGKLNDRRAEFPNVEVQPIYFHPTELSADDWFFLMGAVGNESLYLRKMRQIFRKLRDNVTVNGLLQEIASLSGQQFDFAKDRIGFAREFIREDQRLADHVRPGRLTIVDVRDPYYERSEVLALFVVMLRALARIEYGGAPFNKLIVFDEAHKYMNDRELIGVVVESIREMRHKGVSVLIASQDPLSVPVEVIELSSQILLHRFNSPAWLKHIQKAATALGGLNPGRLNMLRPGEAYVWSSKATDDVFTRQAMKVHLRPRVTHHGGETRIAVE
jgi:hypothetical protein